MEAEGTTARDTADTAAAEAAREAARQSKALSANSKKAAIVAVLLLLVLIALIVLVVWFLASDPARTANIRDIVIVLTALTMILINIAIGGLLLMLVFRLQDLIKVLREEIQPTLANVSQTVRSVTGTARMVSDNVAKPTIKAASFIAGVQGVASAAKKKVKDRVDNR
jgi:hypothetical protein